MTWTGPECVVRRAMALDTPRIWALNNIPNIGATADPDAPLALPIPPGPPTRFPDLADVGASIIDAGGEFLVIESRGHIVGMGGIKPNERGAARVVHVRVHPACRRRGIGSLLLQTLESRAGELGVTELFLDTATNQPEAVAFYQALGYAEVGRETRPEWRWTLVYFTKSVSAAP
jgi:N-acetylglutamate synthase-like GNAT family acetyltransferase